MPLSNFVSKLKSLLEDRNYRWDASSAEQFLINIEPDLSGAKLEASLDGEVGRTGFTDGPLEIKLETDDYFFEFTDEYRQKVPEGQNPESYYSKDPNYDPMRDVDSNMSVFFHSLENRNDVHEIDFGGDASKGPVISITLENGSEVEFSFGSTFPDN